MSYDLTGSKVEGNYMDMFPFTGEVIESRVKYGGKIQHTVKLDKSITVFGDDRTHVLIDTDGTYSDSFKVVI